MYKIYRISCCKSQKEYIGLTKQTIEKRLYQHIKDAKRRKGKTAIGAAIRKYGESSFHITQIASCLTQADALACEVLLIEQHNTMRPNGYNLTPGGEAGFGWMTKEEREIVKVKVSQKLRGRKFDKAHGDKISLTKKGKPLTDKNLASIRKSKGRKIKCVTNGETFFGREGWRGFAKKHGINEERFSCVVACCRGRVSSACGYKFEYAEGKKYKYRPKSTKKSVIGGGIRFDSVTDAVAWLQDNGYPKAATSAVSKACAGKIRHAYGRKWEYL